MSTRREELDLTGPSNPAASIKRARLRASSPRRYGPTVQPPPQPLPVDLQLEIVARSDDVTTVVRCAATSKPLRRAILEPAFRGLLARLADEAGSGGGGSSDPDLLVAVSYRICKHAGGGKDRTVARASPHLRFDGGLLRSFKPASSRDGLLVLRRRVEVELCVCNTFTGHVTPTPLPRTGLKLGRDDGIRGLYRPALLTAAAGGRSFELLVLSRDLRTQTFSAQDGTWGAVRHVSGYLCHGHGWQSSMESATAPVVVGRTIYRLCRRLKRTSEFDRDEEHILGATAEGTKLSVVLAEDGRISMWTLSQQREWSQQVSISRAAIDEQLATTAGLELEACGAIRFESFGGRSGTVLLWVAGVGLVRLDLGTKKATLLCSCSHRDTCWTCLQEMDLASLFRGMKLF
ncbi:hypothetical protein PVAP13_9KG315816 [Panicum virgatum]|uniref:DUF7595 domain-containing protein n=1 Tax=Panicum virgatum TaxID=38727 RepID=A0A8T0NEQ5_PANVG|nr:hypothetical protein PVAP13_9KG315816 [Panicum virgatum]